MSMSISKYLRLVFFPLFSLFASFYCLAQDVAFCYGGDWSSWYPVDAKVSAYTDGSGIILKTSGGREFFTFQINHFIPPTKKEIKEHKKTNQWFEYTGTVTYYVSDSYPTASDLAKHNTLVRPNPRTDVTPVVKRTAIATIKIAPFKKAPYCYNVWFDGIGIGVDIRGFSFGDKGNGPYGGKKRE